MKVVALGSRSSKNDEEVASLSCAVNYDAVNSFSLFYGANGHDALESGARDCAKGHDTVELVAGDTWNSFWLGAGSPSLSQAQTLGPHVGRFL